MRLLNNMKYRQTLLFAAGSVLGCVAALCVKRAMSLHQKPEEVNAPPFLALLRSLFDYQDNGRARADRDDLDALLPYSISPAVEALTSELSRVLKEEGACIFIAVPFNSLSDNVRMRPFFAIAPSENDCEEDHVIPSLRRVPSLRDYLHAPYDNEILACILPGYEEEAKRCLRVLSLIDSSDFGRKWREAYGADAPIRLHDVFASNMCYDTVDGFRVTCHNTQAIAHSSYDLTVNGLPLKDYYIVSVKRF